MEMYKKYFKLFTASFHLSAFTFGGGYVIIPLMQKKFVDDLGWIDHEEMMDLAAIAQSAPGSLAVNASILVGYKVAGPIGVIFSTLGTVLPPLLLLSVISHFYAFFKANPYINGALHTMQAGVAAVIVDVVMKMGKHVIASKNIRLIVTMIVSFILASVFKVNVVIIVLGAGILGAFAPHTMEVKQ